MRIVIRATNWLGDAVMSLPAMRAVRNSFPTSEISVLATPPVAQLYERESCADKVLIYNRERWRIARILRKRRFDLGILFPNSFDSALLFRLAGVPQIVGYDRDMRRFFLTHPVPAPKPTGNRHERFYYLDLLQGAGLVDAYHAVDQPIRLECSEEAAAAGRQTFADQGLTPPVIGVSPGAAFGSAKRWLPERFAESAAQLVSSGGTIVLFGSPRDSDACLDVENDLAARSVKPVNLCGKTTLRQFIDLAAGSSIFLTNDSGAMHVASALGVPTVAIFGSTNPKTTGPAGPRNSIVQHKVECSPCYRRECPIDHPCMTGVTAEQVIATASDLIQLHRSALAGNHR
jgi:heptosyltransferase-2